MRFAAKLEGEEYIRPWLVRGFQYFLCPRCGWTGFPFWSRSSSSHWTTVSPPVACVNSGVWQPAGIGWIPGWMCFQHHCWSEKPAGVKGHNPTGTNGWGSLLPTRKWWVLGLLNLTSKGGLEVVTNHPSIHECIFLRHSTTCFHRHYFSHKTRGLLTLELFEHESDVLLHAFWS